VGGDGVTYDVQNIFSNVANDCIATLAAGHAPVVSAGAAQTITLPAVAILTGSVDDANPPVTATWSQVSGPGTVTFVTPSLVATKASFSAPGVYVLQLAAADGLGLTGSATVQITVNSTGPGPVVNAGTPQTITLPASANLAGSVKDPNPPVITGWSAVSGPGPVTFGDPSALATTASFTTPGVYVLVLTAADSLKLTGSATVQITVNPPPVGPFVNAGSPQTITLPATASLSGSVKDPNPPVSTMWSELSGPGTVTFDNPSALVTTASFSAPGVYVLQLAAIDNLKLSGSATVQITVDANTPATPCTGLCTNPVEFTIHGSFQSGNIGTGAVCLETTAVIHGGNCGNFVSPRSLSVNGTNEPCDAGNWASVPPARNGGYCIQTTAGNFPWGFITAW
jgi:hypothetical protein